jgi:HEAT repeat protein
LGRHASPEAVDALISALATDQPRKLRLAAATALAEVPGEAPVRAALRARLDDADPLVRANALRSLGKHEREAALPAARAWLAKPDTTSIADLHIAALEVLGGADLAKDDALVLKALAPKTAKNAREAALRAAESRLERRVAADAEAAKKLRAGLQEALLPWLDEADIELRWAAVEALGRIGDLSVEPRLRALSRATAIPELAVDAGEAALAVRARGEALPFAPAPEAPPVLDADLESLREELDRLKARLDALSARP